MNRRPQAKDIADVEILRAVEELCFMENAWAVTWNVQAQFPAFPPKVVNAKLSRLLRRGLLTGCDCGCRGDWELTHRGRLAAGIVVGWRPNPQEAGGWITSGSPRGSRSPYWVGHP